MSEDNLTVAQEVTPRIVQRRGNLRPKIDLVKSFYVRLQKWIVTEQFGNDPDFVKGVRYLGKFVQKQRKHTS
jgi:hypothetical protein